MAERVWTIHEWWDGPRYGIADLNGTPCVFESIFSDDLDDWTDEYVLTPITSEQFLLAMEDWQRWKVWRTAFDSGQTTTWTQGLDVAGMIKDSNPKHQLKRTGQFIYAENAQWAYATGITVEWSPETC